MQTIIEVLSKIGDFFTTVFEIVIKLFNDIVYIIKLLADLVPQLPNYFSWLPAEVIALLVIAFAIVVIYKVLGRD